MNYSSFIVKISEKPSQRSLKDDILLTELIVKFPQIRNQKILKTIKVFIWGNLGDDILRYLKKNDYLLIEGYIFLYQIRSPSQDILLSGENQIQISARKIYPFP